VPPPAILHLVSRGGGANKYLRLTSCRPDWFEMRVFFECLSIVDCQQCQLSHDAHTTQHRSQLDRYENWSNPPLINDDSREWGKDGEHESRLFCHNCPNKTVRLEVRWLLLSFLLVVGYANMFWSFPQVVHIAIMSF
jgi:hypothetical protein